MFFFPISQWVGGIFYEHTHRLIASGVGLLTSVLAFWLYGRKSRRLLFWLGLVLVAGGAGLLLALPARRSDGLVLGLIGATALLSSFFWPRCEPAPRWLRHLGLAAFGVVVFQGVLGGLRVVLFKDEIGIFHASLAQLFFVMVCALALLTSKWWQERVAESGTRSIEPGLARVHWWLLAGTGLILAQLVLGATMRHQHAGLAIPDFPLAYGKLWPAMDAQSVAAYNQQRIEVTAANPITASQIGLQMAHRLLAIGILTAVTAAACSARRRLRPKHPLIKLSVLWAILIVVQAVLGAATIWSNKAADVATAHVMVGALSLALGAMLCIVSRFLLVRSLAGFKGSSQPSSPMLPRPVAAGGSS